MRNLIINRKWKFNALLCPVWIFIDKSPTNSLKLEDKRVHLDYSTLDISIGNGKTINIEIDENKHTINLGWNISTDSALHNSVGYEIEEGTEDIYLTINNKYSMTEGSLFFLGPK